MIIVEATSGGMQILAGLGVSMLNGAATLSISPASLPPYTVSSPYTESITGVGGSTPYTYARTSGTLPTGLSLNTSTGVLSGTPTSSNFFTFTIQVTDATSNTASQTYFLGTKTPLQASDFTFQGGSAKWYYLFGQGALTGVEGAQGLTGRYVGSELRLIVNVYAGPVNGFTPVEVYLPSNPSGGAGITYTNVRNWWSASDFWGSMNPQSQDFMSLSWEDLGSGTGRMWTMLGTGYPDSTDEFSTLAISNLHISGADTGNQGTVSNYAGFWGFQDPNFSTMSTLFSVPTNSGISQRCFVGGVTPVPSWFQSSYSVGAYLYLGGRYGSRAIAGGVCCIGLMAVAGPDVSQKSGGSYVYTPNANFKQSAEGADWNVPTSAIKLLADHRASLGNCWYTGGSSLSKDRGFQLSPCYDYYDSQPSFSDYPSADASSLANVVSGSTTFSVTTTTFYTSHTFNAGDRLYVNGNSGNGSGATPANLVTIQSIPTPGTFILTAAWPYGNVTNFNQWGWVASRAELVSGTAPWYSPGPDGNDRWPLLSGYQSNGTWIDGANKTGIVCTGTFPAGDLYYAWSQIYGQGGATEIHIFNPGDLGAVAQGSAQPYSVQPHSMKSIAADLNGLGADSYGSVAGAWFDKQTNTYWVLVTGVSFSGNPHFAVLLPYAVST